MICFFSGEADGWEDLRQKWQKKAKTTKVCAFVEAKPFGVEESYLQFWMRTNLKIQHKF